MISGQIVVPGRSTGAHFTEEDGNRVKLIADMLEWLANELKEAHEADVQEVREPLVEEIDGLYEQMDKMERSGAKENRG